MNQILTCIALPPADSLRRGMIPRTDDAIALPPDFPGSLSDDADLTLIPPSKEPPPDCTCHHVPALRMVEMGAWQGAALKDLPPAGLARWTADATFAPPGGESRADLLHRITPWLTALPTTPPRIRVMADATVIKAIVIAALGGDASMLSRLDIAPCSHTVLTRHTAWRVRMTGASLS